MTTTNRSTLGFSKTIGKFNNDTDTEYPSNIKPSNKKHKTGNMMSKIKSNNNNKMVKMLQQQQQQQQTTTATTIINRSNVHNNNNKNKHKKDMVYYKTNRGQQKNSNICDGNIADNDHENDDDEVDVYEGIVSNNNKKHRLFNESECDANNNHNSNNNKNEQQHQNHQHHHHEHHENVIILDDDVVAVGNGNGVVANDDDDDDVDVETDSLASMETLSDNVAIWVDGERHWVSGVDANTTCMDLICALLNYQNGQQMSNHFDQHQHQQQYNDDPNNLNNYHDGQRKEVVVQKEADDEDEEEAEQQARKIKNLNNNCFNIDDDDDVGIGGGGGGSGIKAIINQSMPTTKETNVKHVTTQENEATTKNERIQAQVKTTTTTTMKKNIQQPMTTTTMMMMRSMARSAVLASEYVIVKQHRHCEEYLDGSAKVFDILPAAKTEGVIALPGRRECDLFLRRLASTTRTTAATTLSTSLSAAASPQLSNGNKSSSNNTQGASLLSTDKDSGMGSPVGSSRSARFRRRKHKSTSNWLAQSNTLHPKATQRNNNSSSNGNNNLAALSGSSLSAAAAVAALATKGAGAGGVGGSGGGSGIDDTLANERLMRIILAQDETIHRQLSLLREKERQISKIEEEKHRARERELGKNYLLETYLKGLDDAALGAPEDDENLGNSVGAIDGDIIDDDDEEIFIDEPYQRKSGKQHETKNEKAYEAYLYHKEHQHYQHNHHHHHHTIARRSKHHTSNKNNSNNKHASHHYAVQSASPHKLPMDHHHQQQQQQHQKQFKPTEGCILGGDIATNINDTIDAATTGDVAVVAVTANADAVDNQQEIELQIFWLEKVYALNKQLQREEETLLKLHAKIRKHQVRCAYQMKNDVLQQIDELDGKLALQCDDICRIEDNLLETNEQLKEKLDALEKLRAELKEELATSTTSILTPPDTVATIDEGDGGEAIEPMPIDIEIDKFESKPRKRKPIVESTLNSSCANENEHWVLALKNTSGGDNDAGGVVMPTAVTNDTESGPTMVVLDAGESAAVKKSFQSKEELLKNFKKNFNNDTIECVATSTVDQLVEVATAIVTPMTAVATAQKELIYESATAATSTAPTTQLKHNYTISHLNQKEQFPKDSSSTYSTAPIPIPTPISSTSSRVTTAVCALPPNDKNTLSTLQTTNAKIFKKPMFEVLARNHHMPMSITTTATTTSMMTMPTTAAASIVMAASTNRNVQPLVPPSLQLLQPLQPHQQKLAGNGGAAALKAFIGSISTMPTLKEANNNINNNSNSIDISRLGTLV